MPKFLIPEMMPEELMAKRIASLRRQVKGIVQYEPTVEELAKGLEKGKITREQIPERLKKFIPGVAGATTAGALLAEQVQAEEPRKKVKKVTKFSQLEQLIIGTPELVEEVEEGIPTIDLTNLRKSLAEGKEPFGIVKPTIDLEQIRKRVTQEQAQMESRTIDLSAIRQQVQTTPSLTPAEGQPIPESVRQAYKEKFGEEAPTVYKKEEIPWWQDFLVDIGLFAVAGAGATAAGTALSLTGAGAVVGVPLIGAGIYMAGKTAQKALTGAPSEPTVTEALSGTELPEATRPAVELLENTILFGGGKEAFRLVKKGFKVVGGATGKTLKGVDLMLHRPFEKIAEPLKPAADWLWDNVIIQPTNIPIPGIKKSVREMFQPAVERLAQSKEMKKRMTASTFRKTEAMKSLTTDVGRSLSHEMESLLPSEQYEVLKGLRGTAIKDLKSSKAKDVLSRFEGRIHESDLNFLYENRFREELSKGLTKSIENIEEEVTPASISRFLKLFETKLPQKAKVADVHNMMREIIAHPKVNDEMKTFIKDMWSTPARTPMAVADAAREASTFYLTEKLIANKGIISEIPREGYMISKWGRFAGKYVPRDIELQLQDIAKIPKIARGVYQKWFLTPWKVSKTITRPAYHIRNLISNAILNDWGGLPFYRADVYMSALKGMRSGSAEWKKFRQMTGAGGTFVQQDIYQLGAGLEYGASTFDKLYNVFEKTVKPMAGLQSAEENLFKFAKYLHNTKEVGMKPAEAALDAMKWCFNYGEVTTSTAYLRKYGMPFATWYTKSIPLMAETAFKHPLRFGKWLAFGSALQSYAMEQVGVTDSEWETIEKTLPNYIQKGIYLMMPWRDDKGRLNLLNMTYILPGIGDVNELWNQAEQGLQVPNPMINILATLQSKKKFSGAPLYYEWEPPSIKWTKTMSYVWEQMSPAIVPGGTDWNTMWRAVTEQEGAPSPEQALSSWFGFKLAPIDPGREARRSEAIRKIYESEINMQMKRDLSRAGTSEEQQAVLRKYQQIRESVANP